MTKVRSDMSVSLDGYVCDPKAKDPPYLDEGFFRVTSWATELATWRERRGRGSGTTDVDDAVVAEMFAQAGAYVMGRRMFDSGEEPWGDDPPFKAPVFVVTHRARESLERSGGTAFFFVTDSHGVTHLSFRFPGGLWPTTRPLPRAYRSNGASDPGPHHPGLAGGCPK